MVNKICNLLSNNKSDFDFVKNTYEEALKKTKYEPQLTFAQKTETLTCNRRKRLQNLIDFKTAIGKLLLGLLRKHFIKSHSH